ncbi:phage tail protein [Pseudoduganella sp. OTU4001]|uniref:phage tail protein n=1 Tax=Pseudoduganella sp. OTU4001 TaxID=3043854 RepID=UPI00313CD763
MSDAYIGELRIFTGNFAPKGWAMCNGQLLAISQNQALFAILGTTYGGDGKTTFGLPNMKQRFPMDAGSGPGLTPRALGEAAGSAAVTLAQAQMPSHTHTLRGASTDASVVSANGALLAAPSSPTPPYHEATALAAMPAGSLGNTGGSQPHNNLQPYLVLNFIIALQGIFPPHD